MDPRDAALGQILGELSARLSLGHGGRTLGLKIAHQPRTRGSIYAASGQTWHTLLADHGSTQGWPCRSTPSTNVGRVSTLGEPSVDFRSVDNGTTHIRYLTIEPESQVALPRGEHADHSPTLTRYRIERGPTDGRPKVNSGSSQTCPRADLESNHCRPEVDQTIRVEQG